MGCIISKKKSPKRNHHLHQRKESRSSRIDDSSQQQQDRSKFSPSRLSEKHPEIAEIGDTDEEEEDEEPKREASTTTTLVVAKEEPEVASGWPAWLVSVAGEALVGWTPRRASSFEKLEKVSKDNTLSSILQ